MRSLSSISYDYVEIVKDRVLKERAMFENYIFVFMCVCAPTSTFKRILFLDTLCCTLQNASSEEFFFLDGDLNCTDHVLDRNHIKPTMPSRKRLTQMIKKYDLCDIWRLLNGNERQYTWVHTRDNVISLTILDRLYAFGQHLNIINSS